MKTFVFLISICFFASCANSQENIINDVFKKYSGKDGVVCMDFFKFKMLVIDDSKNHQNINFYTEIIPKLNKNGYDELMRISEKNEKIIMLAKKSKNKVIEFLMVCGGKDNFLMHITGEIDDDCKEIISKHTDKTGMIRINKYCEE